MKKDWTLILIVSGFILIFVGELFYLKSLTNEK